MPLSASSPPVHYDQTHKSAKNDAFVKAYNADYGRNPDFFSIGGWDGMQLIYDSLKKTGGKTDAQALVDAAKGIEVGKPARPDLDRSGNPRHHPDRLYPPRREGRTARSQNVEFDKVENVKDPVKERMKKK